MSIILFWDLITNPRKFYALRIPHTYGSFATGEPRKGSVFEVGTTGIAYVVNCNKPTEFGFGYKDAEWLTLSDSPLR